MEHWIDRGLSASTIESNLSNIRTLCRWVGKQGMIDNIQQHDFAQYNIKRQHASVVDTSWCDNDILNKIAKMSVDYPIVAIQFKLQHVFHLGVKESMIFRPYEGDHGNYLERKTGPKGRRKCVKVKIDSLQQRRVLEQAKHYMNSSTGSLIPDGYTLKKWTNHYYYVLRKYGIRRRRNQPLAS